MLDAEFVSNKCKAVKDRKDPVKSKRPEQPLTGPGVGGRVGSISITQYFMHDQMKEKSVRVEDPWEALLAYAAKHTKGETTTTTTSTSSTTNPPSHTDVSLFGSAYIKSIYYFYADRLRRLTVFSSLNAIARRLVFFPLYTPRPSLSWRNFIAGLGHPCANATR